MQRLNVHSGGGSSSGGSHGICDYSIGSQNLRYINTSGHVQGSENPFRGGERLIHIEEDSRRVSSSLNLSDRSDATERDGHHKARRPPLIVLNFSTDSPEQEEKSQVRRSSGKGKTLQTARRTNANVERTATRSPFLCHRVPIFMHGERRAVTNRSIDSVTSRSLLE